MYVVSITRQCEIRRENLSRKLRLFGSHDARPSMASVTITAPPRPFSRNGDEDSDGAQYEAGQWLALTASGPGAPLLLMSALASHNRMLAMSTSCHWPPRSPQSSLGSLFSTSPPPVSKASRADAYWFNFMCAMASTKYAAASRSRICPAAA